VIAETRLTSLRPWGYDLGGAYIVRFRAHREGSSARLRAPKDFAYEAGIAGHSCFTIHVGPYTYSGKVIVDDRVRMTIPAEIGSLILSGSDRCDFWGFVRVGESVEIYEAGDPQRRITEYIRLDPFSEVIGSRSPRYGKGQRYCERCELAFYTMSLRCPICGARMRTEPKKGEGREIHRPGEIWPRGLKYGARDPGGMARKAFTVRFELDGDEFHLVPSRYAD